MSWQAATFVLLGAVVLGGFAWYERSRPPARLVALVAALAALAVAGRLVLTPIPNVVATTDIALITGYALGAAPGFAVGALAAPISNIWLGQGPWTAWEAAGWGMVGVAGAWAAAISGRRLGRLGLALVCAAAGLAYGALLDYSVMVTYGGEQSLDRYLALSARGIPFNVAHAAGNFAIALAAGPALVRMISRFATRLAFEWRPAGAAPLAVLVLALTLAGNALAPPNAEAASAARWLAQTQNGDGGFAAEPGQASSPPMTGWAMLGLEAAGRNPLDVRSGGRTPVDYLRAEADRLRSAGDLERTILALVGAGLDPRRFAGADLIAKLRQRRSKDGSIDGQVNLTAFYVLALRAAGVDRDRLRRAARWLRAAQNRDGGWGIQPEAPSEADSTGAALQALAAAGASDAAIGKGVRFLARAQARGGGFALAGSGVVNAQSTAWAVQGLVAAGAGDDEVADALRYLGSLQTDDGHYRYSASSGQTPVWVTAQALLAVERRAFPLPAVARVEREPRPSQQAEAAVGTEGNEQPTVPATPDRSRKFNRQRQPVEKSTKTVHKSTGSASTDPQPATTTSPSEPLAATTTTPSSEPTKPDDSATAPYVIAGFGALAAVLAAGFVWYRRRLP